MLFALPAAKLPPYLPEHLAPMMAGKRYDMALPEAVRRRMRTPKKIGVADHVHASRVVPDGPHQGVWRHELAPQSVKIMNTYSAPYVREILFCGVEQAAKTATMLNCVHWSVDISPADIFYAMPTEDTAKKIFEGKLNPMLQQSPSTKKYISKSQDDTSLKRVRLTNGVTIRPAWANSPASMASFPAKYIFGDEVDKFPERSGKEASPIKLLKKRTRLYRGAAKCFFASTPAQGFIYDECMAADQVWQWQNKCPHCTNFVKFEGKHLVFSEDVSLVCPECGAEIDLKGFEMSQRFASWVCIKGGEIARPGTVGFHMPAWGCLDIPLSEIADNYIAMQRTGTVADAIAWANGYEAANYVHEQKDREEDFVLRLVDDEQPRSVVPDNTWGILITADTQQLGFFYQVWAVGYGTDLPLAMIEHGQLETFGQLQEKQLKEYYDAGGKKYLAKAGFIDSGGGTNPARPKHTRTREVYDFCRKNKFWRPLKGRRDMEASWNVKRRDFYPKSVGKKVPIPGGLNLYTINVTFYKNELDGKLQKEPGDPGAIMLHADVGKDFASQLCAEYQDERGYWICPNGKDNHHWDCCVYLLALCDIMQVREKKRAVATGGTTTKKRGPRGGGFATNF